MVLGIPATTTLRPRLLISCEVEELKFMGIRDEAEAVMVSPANFPDFAYLSLYFYT
jgi:hypothetical protein